MITVIIDTNILIDAGGDDFNYSRRIMNEVMRGNVRAVASHKILRENRLILNRLVNDPQHYELVNNFFNCIEVVLVNKRVKMVKYDEDDNKFLACAEEAGADYIISNDSHLWEIGEYKGTKILTPEDFWHEYKTLNNESGNEAWQEWIRGIIK
ncbi:putative toxin-antitoxin system toxin component, PIN family [Candidatus Kuenenbacteria bacterium CG11_big_fil_rev_8_21_14_0_20_37_9]|uniref:Putative toxin-antitoxin system toxin component, PIN family n=2 Tax=Candidatus Kueneniibacteriota TaxID=1752740 RepID=A0A2M6XT01_9BACT|nr:MAG: putative toxin-antitoxin system toxin component, PIN family [Candidatus Kuenenbacteria bacterium CG1_02_38_13]PIR05875.1 MAG: putative toxin-antitoxin system toxin component, PIN family [Candidatus Kuenenbacteria bacterium CG11_big_fil_rev_8_21_14_0_20_37_9]PIU10774.1 MAG: putative toxin-antitoxin system toxin component, PIN family [Candidatus Kuenenbacteria bacterium CG08_land_8_20_14_0_20_37_23]